MFDYYRYRFSLLKSWVPANGGGLMIWIGLLGAILFFVLIGLYMPSFTSLISRQPVPEPAGYFGALVLAMLFLAHLAGYWPRVALSLLAAIGATVGIGAAAIIAWEHAHNYPSLPFDYPTWKAVTIALCFTVYGISIGGLAIRWLLYRVSDSRLTCCSACRLY